MITLFSNVYRFIFAEGAKPSSTTAGESSVVQMLGSLFDRVESEYGVFATRFYRAFRPKARKHFYSSLYYEKELFIGIIQTNLFTIKHLT